MRRAITAGVAAALMGLILLLAGCPEDKGGGPVQRTDAEQSSGHHGSCH